MWVTSTLISETEVMPNYWLSSENLIPRVIESTRTYLDPETGLEIQPYVVPFSNYKTQVKSAPSDINQYASANWLYNYNQDIKIDRSNVAETIIPSPKSLIVHDKSKKLDLSKGIDLRLEGVEISAIEASIMRLENLGILENSQGVPTTIVIDKNANLGDEGYQLNTREKGIKIVASTGAGAFYGLQSLASLLSLENLTVSLVSVVDEPRYEYRGQHIDVARNFHSKAMILRLIEQMGAYKLNKLHLHLAEDEGWRLEIPSLPELTQVGSERCMDLTDTQCMQPQLGGAGSTARDGFYSAQDYIDILKYAKKTSYSGNPFT